MRRRMKRLGWMAGLALLALSSPSGPRPGGDVTACTDWRTVRGVSLDGHWVSWDNQTYRYDYTCRVKDYRCPNKEDAGETYVHKQVGSGGCPGCYPAPPVWPPPPAWPPPHDICCWDFHGVCSYYYPPDPPDPPEIPVP
jgi:hypothetical protein